MKVSAATFVLLGGFALASASVIGTGCSPALGAREQPVLPPYVGHATEVFDDGIDSRSVGLELESNTTAMADPLLRERTQVSDSVVRIRIGTVTVKQEDAGPTYVLTCRILEKVTGPRPPEDPFTIVIRKQSPSAGLLKTFETRLVGVQFIAFLRSFARTDGETETHFHFAPDTKEQLDAVRHASLLGEFK